MRTSKLLSWTVCLLLASAAAAQPPELVLQTGHTAAVNGVALSPDGAYLLTGSRDKTAKLWDAATGRLLRTYSGHSEEVTAVAFSADGQEFVSGSADSSAILWETSTGKILRRFIGHTSGINSVALSPDSRRLITSGSWDRTAILWDVSTAKPLHVFRADSDDGWTKAVAFSQDGQKVLTAFGDYAILWDARAGNRLQRLAPHPEMTCVAFSPDGRLAVSGSNDSTIVVWDLQTGEKVTSLPGCLRGVTAVAFSPDGKTLFSVGHENNVRWRDVAAWKPNGRFRPPDVATGEQLHTFATSEHEGATATGNSPEPRHRSSINALAVSHDGKTIATGSYDQTAIVWNVQSRRALMQTSGGEADYHARLLGAAFRRDGSEIVLMDNRGFAHWTAEGGVPARDYYDENVNFSDALLSADGRFLLIDAGFYSEEIALWDIDGGQKVRVLPRDDQEVRFAIAPDGRYAAVATEDRSVILWDTATGEQLRTIISAGEVRVLKFSPDGKRLMIATVDPYEAVLWDVNDGRKLQTLPVSAIPRTLTFSADGRRVLIGDWDHVATLFDLETGSRLARFAGHSNMISSLAVDRTGRYLVSGSQDNTAAVWDLATGLKVRTLEGHSDCVSTVAISPDGKQVLTGSWDNAAVLWDLATGKSVRTLTGHRSSVYTVAFSPDGRQIISAGSGSAFVWDAGSGQRLISFDAKPRPESAVALHPGGGEIAAAYANDAALWDVTTGHVVRSFKGHTEKVDATAFSPNGRFLATGSRDKTVSVWDAGSGRRIRTLEGHTQGVRSIAFSPDGRLLLSGAEVEGIVWEVATGRRLATLSGERSFETVAFAPDGSALTAGYDERIIEWDAESGQRRRVISAHTSFLQDVVLSPDGLHVLTASEDNTAILWEADTGNMVRKLIGHTGAVKSVDFHPNGELALTASEDSTVRLWDLATGEELARIVYTGQEGDWLVATPSGLFDGSEGGRKNVAYRVGDRLNVVPVDRFFQDFYRPGLLAEIWRGERPLPQVELGNKLAPMVRIVSPKEKAATVETPVVTLDVEVTDRGGGARGPWLLHNGARVLIQGTTQVDGKVHRRSFDVPLIEGENRLEVRAASEDGSWESEPAVVVLRFEQPLAAPDLYLLAVGVNRYAEESINLKFAAADAQAIAELFQQRGPALYGEGKVRVTQLLDNEATKDGIQKALADIAVEAKPQDVLVVFLAGHGTMVGQRYFFIPHEFRKQADNLEDDIRAQGLASDVLGDWLAAVPALKRLQIFDTCQSGGALGGMRMTRNPFAFRGALERLSRSQGGFTIAAASATADAQEIPQLGHGVLTYALLAGVGRVQGGPLERQPLQLADTAVLDVRDWLGFAQDKVPLLTGLMLGQEQFVEFHATGQSFPVLPLEN